MIAPVTSHSVVMIGFSDRYSGLQLKPGGPSITRQDIAKRTRHRLCQDSSGNGNPKQVFGQSRAHLRLAELD